MKVSQPYIKHFVNYYGFFLGKVNIIKISRINITRCKKEIQAVDVARRSINSFANHLKFFLTIFEDHVPTSYCVGSTKSNAAPSVKAFRTKTELPFQSAGLYGRQQQPTRDMIFCGARIA